MGCGAGNAGDRGDSSVIYLITGRPGAGKTSNTLAYIYKQSRPVRSWFGFRSVPGIFEDREIYVNHVNGLKPELFHSISDDDLLSANIPVKSVLLVDEGHRIFPKRSPTSRVPGHVEYWAEHRHHGVDIYIITQSPSSIDAFIRERVDTHIHYSKPFGLSVMSYTWAGVCTDPDNKSKRKDSIKAGVRLDKKVFDLYESTVSDTTQKRVPSWLYAVPFLLAFVVGLMWWGLGGMLGGKESSIEQSAFKPSGSPMVAAVLPVSVPMIDVKALRYSGNIASAGLTRHYYTLTDQGGGERSLTGEDLAEFGVVMQFRAGYPYALLTDGSEYLIPLPGKELEKPSDMGFEEVPSSVALSEKLSSNTSKELDQ